MSLRPGPGSLVCEAAGAGVKGLELLAGSCTVVLVSGCAVLVAAWQSAGGCTHTL